MDALLGSSHVLEDVTDADERSTTISGAVDTVIQCKVAQASGTLSAQTCAVLTALMRTFMNMGDRTVFPDQPQMVWRRLNDQPWPDNYNPYPVPQD